MRGTNHLIGLLNFLTFLLSIPILGAGIWLATRASSTDCLRFLQWPIIIIGVSIMVISLAGLAGACYRFRPRPHEPFLPRLPGGLLRVARGEVASDSYWGKIASCVRDSKPYSVRLLQAPHGCGYVYGNETYWTSLAGGTTSANPDCMRWSDDQSQLCYSCNSCKAGVLASIKQSWRKASVINIIILVLLVITYVVGCAAFRNNRRMDNDEPYGEARMTKAKPSWIQF
ncbi:hypothetical protein MLD38_017304 [Melastoma candidum]|uniref:Uncharacterized protein n=1 Tax=Melastoma candidum TaxID=119954 RepID=A0ACB9QQ74_9MYRT|nr:hypothetical protein MLD38_017304 [Melastoma candidum]